MIYWAGPYEIKSPYTYKNDPPKIEQRYDMLIGSLVKIAHIYGTGGQYSGQLYMPCEIVTTVKNVSLKEAQDAFEKGLHTWMANAGMTFDEDILRMIKS